MTSQIVSSTIDADYPVSGQDNDSQGFRDNFTIIKDGLAVAASEITDLQTYSAKLGNSEGTEVINDFGGNIIANARTNRLYGSVYETTSTPTTNVSLVDGEYQNITMTGNHTLTFTDWPETERYAKLRLALKSNGAERTITFASEGGGVLRTEITEAVAEATSVYRKAYASASSAAAFSFETRNLTKGAFQAGDLLFGTGLTGNVTATSVASLSNSATETVGPYTLTYSGINGSAFVTTTTSPATITDGSKVKFSDTTGIALTAGTTYYAYGRTGSGFYISDTYAGATAAVKIPATNLSGTITVTEITVSGSDTIVTATGVTSAFQAGTQVVLTLADYPTVTFDPAYTGGSTYTFFAYATSAVSGTITFKLAASYADAIAATPITAPTGTFTGSVANVAWFGLFSGTATASFPEFENYNRIVVGSNTGFFVGMPVKFTGTSFGNIVNGTQYYVTELISSTALRVSLAIGGSPIEVSSATGTMPMEPTTAVQATLSTAQVITGSSSVILTASKDSFPSPFTVSSDVNRIKVVEAWTADGGANVFLKYLGEYA